jgi:hypothetical protein
MSKAAQGFSLRHTDRTPQTASSQAAGPNPRRTPLIGKRAIYGWKQVYSIKTGIYEGPFSAKHFIRRLFMHLTFYGAVREVTGSMHLLTAENDRILLDCGMFQGRRKESAEKNRIMPISITPGVFRC